MSSTPIIQDFDLREQKILGVTVSNDRAEVKRLVELTLKPGFNEVVLKNVSNLLFHDSLRVKGRGEAKIHDVVVKNEPVLKADADTEKLAELRGILKDHEKKLNYLQDRKVILGKQYEALNGMIAQVGSSLFNPPKDAQGASLNKETLVDVNGFFEFYSENAEKMVDKGRQIDIEIEEISDLVRKARDDLNVHETGKRYQTVNNAHITLEADEEIEVELEVTYQVHNTSWTPSYDIRVDTELSKMNLTYFARIRQHTGEDWNNAPLTLTTAQPSLGGQIPQLGTLNVSFKTQPVVIQSHVFGAAPQMMRRAAPCSSSSSTGLFGGTALPTRAEMDVVVASEVKHSALSTEFKIPREATIPNATDAHKVTIGIIDLSPSLNHQSVPSRNPSAFLTASVLNTSDFTLLAGETSIFLDGAFIAKSALKNVSPGERFDCSLGVDTGIRVEYKPAKKYHQHAGLFTKHSSNVVEQDIVIKNTRQTQPILITMKHHVPRSSDEKIKVTLVAPSLSTPEESEDPKEPTEGVKLNLMNNLEWTVKIPPNTSKTLQIKYTIDHPKEEKIEFQERF